MILARRFFLENIVDYVLKKMSENSYTPQDISIFKYGFNILLRYIILFLVVFFITFFYGNFVNILLFDLILIILRFHCGGFHSKNVYTCFFLSVFTMAIVPQLLLNISVSKETYFFITEMFIVSQIIIRPIKNSKKIYNAKFIDNLKKIKKIVLILINSIYLVLLCYTCKLERMITYACGINTFSMLIEIIIKWREEKKDVWIFR